MVTKRDSQCLKYAKATLQLKKKSNVKLISVIVASGESELEQ